MSTFNPQPEAEDSFARFVLAGLARFGLEPTSQELAVMEAVEGIYRPNFEALIEADLEGVKPEADFDPARAP